jgi:serine/threonine-protein kinase HipA
MRLLVRQFDRLVGFLESTPDRGVVFRYVGEYLREPGAHALSLSLPLREAEFSQAATMPFFAGLLPDGDLRRRVSDSLHVSESSTLKLLDALGGECAGTVSLLRDEEDEDIRRASPSPKVTTLGTKYKEISENELAALILDSERRPLLVPQGGARLSLAGAQDKVPLFYHGDSWWLPLGNSPSSHILKPASTAFPDLVANEFFCMRLAAALGLAVPKVELKVIGRPVLVIDRYDRAWTDSGAIERIHQEDFCQALGIMPDRKYETDGGPGFSEIAKIIRQSCFAPLRDIEALICVALFNFLVGNCDAHGKNFSLLYSETGIRLAPFYDLVSTMVYPELSAKLSMRMGNEYRPDRIKSSELERFARDIGVRPRLVENSLSELGLAASVAWDKIGRLPELADHTDLVMNIRRGWEERIGQVTP